VASHPQALIQSTNCHTGDRSLSLRVLESVHIGGQCGFTLSDQRAVSEVRRCDKVISSDREATLLQVLYGLTISKEGSSTHHFDGFKVPLTLISLVVI